MEPAHYGPEGIGIELSRARIGSAWNVQGEAESTSFVAEVARLFGLALPTSNSCTVSSANGPALLAMWLGPRSWLLVEGSLPSHEGDLQAQRPGLQRLLRFGACRDAVNATGGALFDVSAGRVAFTIRGADAATVLATRCPLDFDPRVFSPGSCAQSVLGRTSALIYRHRETSGFSVMVATSLAADAWRGLCLASAAGGYDVTAPAAFDPR